MNHLRKNASLIFVLTVSMSFVLIGEKLLKDLGGFESLLFVISLAFSVVVGLLVYLITLRSLGKNAEETETSQQSG